MTTTLPQPSSRPVSDLPCPQALSHYDTELRAVLAAAADTPAPADAAGFAPAWELPAPGADLERFFGPSGISAHTVDEHGGRSIGLLHLMHNPRTRTTKTFASLVIVARAVAHIRRTGEPVMIITPSSANKATALRDAVLRAHESGLATPEQLRIVCVVPSASTDKLWHCGLADDDASRTAHPLAVLRTDEPGEVKQLARAVVDQETGALFADTGFRLWHSLDLRNYQVADAVRALFERDFLPPGERTHAHSVSSAFGLLGHFHGQQWHTGKEWPELGGQYFLVQHLGTPDMVASLHHGRFDHRPAWESRDGLFHQDRDPHFPRIAHAPDEQLDSTFYTRSPVTSPRMNEIIDRQGGGGVVVSLAECLERYPRIRHVLAPHGVHLPADPRELREWSLVMALTGVLNGIDRGLIATREVLVHGSGSYGTGDFRTADARHLRHVSSLDDLRRVVRAAAA
ncbi:DUF6002 family protein [Streptomyces subrutilus]|uniref:Uncharacterized protein n=1 Tax=Streptomyces subrutilus TaxID=36818 RepID=A0A5P2UTA3_9ACTN|nr:DUF6002 family protein [Streptomyces subrutilus]QEU82100.1 hypothetical protein CP968_30925 [Streptomyces subrutilus]GGZ89147.1 hypothetical protein GCM10010371_56390 [Streptomyces subrutilus]